VGALYPNKTVFMSKIEWYKNKFFGWLLKKLGSIPLDRDKPSLSSIKEGLQVLKSDKRLAIFPEGARNFVTNELQEIKQGTALFAVKGQAILTPIIIYDRLKMFKQAYVIVGKPIDFSKYYNVRFTDEVSQECTKIISDAMHDLQKELFEIVEAEKNKKRKKK
jgi:1-acyl-sn-glycerol-3-phosphate acyltransferase